MIVRKRLGVNVGATALLAVGLVAGTMARPGAADATPCSGIGAGTCTTAGTATLTGAGLTMVSPGTLTWTGAIIGAQQTIYDALTADTALDATDLRGLISSNGSSGWDITATATTFTGTTTARTLTDTGSGQVLAFGGGSTSGTATNKPSSVCITTGTCTVATATTTGYPLFIPTGNSATPVKIYNASAGTGTGLIQIGNSALVTGTNPAVWSVTLPAGVAADAYTSTITTTIAAGP